MSAPDNAYVLKHDDGHLDEYQPDGMLKRVDYKDQENVECQGCGWEGKLGDLLGCDDQETMWCPRCRGSGWMWA